MIAETYIAPSNFKDVKILIYLRVKDLRITRDETISRVRRNLFLVLLNIFIPSIKNSMTFDEMKNALNLKGQ